MNSGNTYVSIRSNSPAYNDKNDNLFLLSSMNDTTISGITEDGNYTEIYWGLGFTLKKVYYLDEKSSEDNHMYHLSGEEFLLFNKFRLWSWTA